METLQVLDTSSQPSRALSSNARRDFESEVVLQVEYIKFNQFYDRHLDNYVWIFWIYCREL